MLSLILSIISLSTRRPVSELDWQEPSAWYAMLEALTGQVQMFQNIDGCGQQSSLQSIMPVRKESTVVKTS
jgi:hypothetical protein